MSNGSKPPGWEEGDPLPPHATPTTPDTPNPPPTDPGKADDPHKE